MMNILNNEKTISMQLKLKYRNLPPMKALLKIHDEFIEGYKSKNIIKCKRALVEYNFMKAKVTDVNPRELTDDLKNMIDLMKVIDPTYDPYTELKDYTPLKGRLYSECLFLTESGNLDSAARMLSDKVSKYILSTNNFKDYQWRTYTNELSKDKNGLTHYVFYDESDFAVNEVFRDLYEEFFKGKTSYDSEYVFYKIPNSKYFIYLSGDHKSTTIGFDLKSNLI